MHLLHCNNWYCKLHSRNRYIRNSVINFVRKAVQAVYNIISNEIEHKKFTRWITEAQRILKKKKPQLAVYLSFCNLVIVSTLLYK